jgi:malate synthase
MLENSIGRGHLVVADNVRRQYDDVIHAVVVDALLALAVFDSERKALMAERLARRAKRARNRETIQFLEPAETIPRTQISVASARAGAFVGGEIPVRLKRQWIQGTGPAARPHAKLETSLRNPAYALLSGADGWMFDGEDALGQTSSMSFDNQRNLKLAIGRAPLFMDVAKGVAAEMNAWSRSFLGRSIIDDWSQQLNLTTPLFRPRGLHLDDRHVYWANGSGFSASIVDLVLYVVNNGASLRDLGLPVVVYLPKIQTAAEAALWSEMLDAMERYIALTPGSIKAYVLVEQVEASFQLMEIRAALGQHFVGFNTGRWDYINSVSDAMAWNEAFQNPNINAITMTYGYMRAYEDRVRRAVNTPDSNGRCGLWQGGMEPNIPVGSEEGVRDAMRRAIAGAEREQAAGASGKWVAHWKMVHVVRPVWEQFGQLNQLGRAFEPLTYSLEDAAALFGCDPAPRTIRGARDLLSVALQYCNAFAQGYQAAALKPADSFGDDDVLYLMEDMATGEIRLSILWEWIHKSAPVTEDDQDTDVRAGTQFSWSLFERLLDEEYRKLLAAADRDVHDSSKSTTLPIAREIVIRYLAEQAKAPWAIDFLNLNLNNHDLDVAQVRIEEYLSALRRGTRITDNVDMRPIGANELKGV